MAPAVQRIRFPFGINGSVGRLRQEPDYDAYIVQLIKQVIFTGAGERINRPQFGAGVRRLLFAPNSIGTASLAQTVVFQALNTWLGTLIRVDRVEVAAEAEKLLIDVSYTILQKGEQRFLNLEATL
ncbi:MAG: GPW/gp25 family protein [Terrimicrobiaceae bacterium]